MNRNEAITELVDRKVAVIQTNVLAAQSKEHKSGLADAFVSALIHEFDDLSKDIFIHDGFPVQIEFDKSGLCATIPCVNHCCFGAPYVVSGRIEHTDLSDIDIEVLVYAIREGSASEKDVAFLEGFLSAQMMLVCYRITDDYPDPMCEGHRTTTTEVRWYPRDIDPESLWQSIYPNGTVTQVERVADAKPHV